MTANQELIKIIPYIIEALRSVSGLLDGQYVSLNGDWEENSETCRAFSKAEDALKKYDLIISTECRNQIGIGSM